MIKKVYKKEISVLFVFYLIILKYLIKDRDSFFTLYMYRLIIGSFFQEKKASEIIGNLEQEDKDDKNLSGKSACCGGVSSLLNRGKYYYNARWYFRNSLNNNPPETSNAYTPGLYSAYEPSTGRFITEDPVRDGNLKDSIFKINYENDWIYIIDK